MTEGIKEKFLRYFTVTLVLAILVGGLAAAWPSYVRRNSLKAQDAALAAQIEEKKREIARLQDFQRRFRTDRDFVESIARQNRRVYPGELVFLFEDDK
ncbi:MAG: septum formation initiator family protein [Kiritimatiellae bacterium]|nr:septum formation initiator family protein [Kiritimatiellia bacterium]